MGQSSTSRSSLTITLRGYIVSSHPDLAVAWVRLASAKNIHSPCQLSRRDIAPRVPARLSGVFHYTQRLVPGNEVKSNPPHTAPQHALLLTLGNVRHYDAVLMCDTVPQLCRVCLFAKCVWLSIFIA